MKIASIVYNCFTNDSRVEKQATSLAEAKYELTVYALWKKGFQEHERKSGFSVRRIKIYTSLLSGSLGKLIKFIEFTLKVSWMTRQSGIVHCHDYHPLPAMLIAKFFLRSNCFLIYDAHEFESQKIGFGRFSRFAINFLEKISAKFIDGFITVSESILEMYIQLFPEIPKTIILNCPNSENLIVSNKFETSLSLGKGTVKCIYQGGFIPYRGIPELLEASRYSDLKGINFIFMGDGGITQAGKDLERQILRKSETHQNIHHVKSVPIEELLEYTSSATIGCVLTIDNCLNHKYSLPNKFFEYAMAGLPMLVSDLPEMRKLVEKYNCGVICETITPEGIAKGIKKLLDQDLEKLGKNARKMAEAHSWEAQEEKLLTLYNKVLEKKAV
ncbi:MAG: glycosyltransferase [Verrucomicrobiota bacterium]|nr:glycosyltransferase [Verrucomicrobiota bacterium]